MTDDDLSGLSGFMSTMTLSDEDVSPKKKSNDSIGMTTFSISCYTINILSHTPFLRKNSINDKL